MEVMEQMEQLCVPEPKWILDRRDSGNLFWRREPTGNNSRVKFRCEVEVKEFCRAEHELVRAPWEMSSDNFPETPSHLSMGVTCIFCLAITVLLPWYVMGAGV